jgi:hypothetical protein
MQSTARLTSGNEPAGIVFVLDTSASRSPATEIEGFFFIGAITILVYLKYAITIHVSGTLPLQFSLSLKSAIVYARQTFGPACRLTWHMIDRIRPYPVFM